MNRPIQKQGVSSLDCVPYTSGDGDVPKCQHSCASSSTPFKLYKASSSKHVGDLSKPASHVSDIMSALLQGPLDATFNVFDDFDDYSSGVYKHKSGGYRGLHSVKIVGYGTDPVGGPYWTVQNSWGPNWGEQNGFFRIARGVNECGFERLVYQGTADIASVTLQGQ
mmetsp:Transcript_34417/g.80432  ORF Transcript_34417/g.80432 Transcript_34417/m.80432 type:complete len:166 (-) Transcript_34417:27-524(-)